MSIYQKQAEERVLKNKALMHNICHTPIVTNDEVAEKFVKGWSKINALSEEEKKKLKGLSSEELQKRWTDGDMKVAVIQTQKAIDQVSKAMVGGIIEKSATYDGLKNPDLQTLTYMTGVQTAGGAGFDMGWTNAFNMVDSSNAELLKVMDLAGSSMLYEQRRSSDRIRFNQLFNLSHDSISRRFFAGGVEYNGRELRFVSAFDVNTILASLRMATVHTMDRFAYRKIAEVTSSSNVWTASTLNVKGFTGGTTDLEKIQNKYIRARKILNAANFTLKNIATQVQPSIGKKLLNFNTAPINVSATDPVYFFVNHKWYEWLEEMRRLQVSQEGVVTPLMSNIVFVQSALMPESGGLSIAAADSHDDYGFFEIATEKQGAETLAGMLMIPDGRNVMGTFRNPTFFTDVPSNAGESTQVAVKMEMNAAKELRQYAYVTLGNDLL